ncbi:MAG: nucleotidyl transferase AbiEii/AbiGii toxin family protein, partial [Patescibacteria group bacterium]
VLILKTLYGSKYNTALIFMGGTCLRICYDIPRFSEDLDFNLATKEFDFLEMLSYLNNDLRKMGIKVDVVGKAEKIVYKGFIRFSDVLYKFKLSPHKDQKLSIKFEIDSNPQKNYINETNIISKFGFNFIIKNVNLSSMMAGKIHACFSRGYYKGRDFYDLIWYLNKKIEPNFKLLQEFKMNIKNRVELIDYLNQEIRKIKINVVVKDAYQFLEDKSEIKILENIKELYPQVAKRYLL